MPQNAELRKSYFHNGVKDKKNPDFYFRGRFVDGKSMLSIEPTENEKILKRKIQNRLNEAFNQADDALLEIPTTINLNLFMSSIYGKLNSSINSHIVYVKYGENFFEIKNPDK